MKKILTVLTCLILTFFIYTPTPAFAKTVQKGLFEGTTTGGSQIINGKTTPTGCVESGDCSLCDLLTVFTNVSRWILSVMGGLAMLFFIIAGINFILSLGNTERVEKSKKMIIGTVIGIVIILGAWTAVNLVFMALVTPDSNLDEKKVVRIWGSTPWSTLEGMCK